MSDNDHRDLIRYAERIVWVAGWHLLEEAALAQLASTRGLARGRLIPRSAVIQLVTYDGEQLGHVRRHSAEGPDERWVAVLRHQAREFGTYESAAAAAQALAHACASPPGTPAETSPAAAPAVRAVLPEPDLPVPARMLAGEDSTAGHPGDLPEMTKLTVYPGRTERAYRVPAFVAVCDLLHRRGIAGATVLLGVDGTAHGQRQRASFFSRNAQTPMMVISVGSGEQIGRVLPELGALPRRPLLSLERVTICKRDGELLSAPDALPGTGQGGMPLWHKLMVYTSESALHDGQPIHRAIVRRLRTAGISGATTLRGVWGFHGDHPPHGDRLLQLGRRVPAVTIVVDTPERIAAAFTVIDELTDERGLVTSETVPSVRTGSAETPGHPAA